MWKGLQINILTSEFSEDCRSYWLISIFILTVVVEEARENHGQAIGKLYHLWLRVECTLFVIYKVGREPTPYNMLLNLHMSVYNIILWPIKSSQFDNWFVNNRDFQCSNRKVWRYQRVNQNPYIEEEQTQWSNENKQKDKQRSTKHTFKTKDRVTGTPLKTGCELRCSERLSSSSHCK